MEGGDRGRGRLPGGERRFEGVAAGRPLRLGIVGCGGLVRGRHLPVLRDLPEIAVVAVADLDPRAAADVAAAFDVPRRYATAEELAADPELDAVAVCTPPSAHVGAAIAALEAGKPVFVEKPIAVSLDDADRLLEHEARSPMPALMGFNLRWHRLLLRARRLVQEGELGWVHCMVSTFTDPLLRRELPAWRSRRDHGGGVLLDRAVHHF
ncbi:MAG TPA: Gfo/Idh/MocA family oxidoreductase, partial [Thermoanaerobaculia bacterium]|nr:Gfo/Idh/MocA family oxidoreductase [Thermoanaerobaculia bacterium]